LNLISRMREHMAQSLTTTPSAREPYLALHIRRGDCKGTSWRYHDKNLPLSLYIQAVRETWSRIIGSTTGDHPINVYVASDDPAAQKDYMEKTKSKRLFSLARSKDHALQNLASPMPYIQSEFNTFTVGERTRLTRGMIVDLAMISGLWSTENDIQPEAVICGIRCIRLTCYNTCLMWPAARSFAVFLLLGLVGRELLDLRRVTGRMELWETQPSVGWKWIMRVPSPQCGKDFDCFNTSRA
jgi:hypothetical protein